MTSPHVTAARRNAAVLGATGITVGVLFLLPASTNNTRTHRAAPSAPAGLVRSPTAIPTSSAKAAPRTQLVNGTAVDTRYGPVQVQVKVRAGRVISATAIDYPQGTGRDQEINSYAIPILERETVQAQSARIDTVSGATYTSDGYQRSLQAALDAAHAS